MHRFVIATCLTACLAAADTRASSIPSLPTSQGLIVLGSDAHPLPPEGSDATAAIQAGIDAGSVVILPSGRWLLSAELNLWKGVRLIGVGPTKPVLELAAKTPGYDGKRPTYLVNFRAKKPKPGQAPKDADNDTFGSGLINLRLVVGPGNPAAWAVRYRVAQLCVLEDLDIALAPEAGGIDQIANVIRGCRIVGGHTAIRSNSPMAWQVLIADCEFRGQSEVSIVTYGCAPMVMRCTFADLPLALAAKPGKQEMVLAEGCRFERVDVVYREGEAEKSYDCLNLVDATGIATPVLIRRGESQGEDLAAPAADWSLRRVLDGLIVEDGESGFRTVVLEEPARERPAPTLPRMDGLRSITEFGAVGDNETDCTTAFRQALNEAKRVFVPPGNWRISDTISLGEGCELIGLHPRATKITFDPEAAGYADPANPKPLIAVDGADAQIRGIGVGNCKHPGAIVLRWRGGPTSRLADCWTQWGKKDQPGPVATLLIEGAGTFTNLWLVNPGATHPMVIRGSQGPGLVELASLEHHGDHELVIEDSSGWQLNGIQTERSDHHPEMAIRVTNSHDLSFGNLYAYRTSRSRAERDAAILAEGVSDLRIHGLRVYAGSWNGGIPYENAIRFTDSGAAIPNRVAAAVLVP